MRLSGRLCERGKGTGLAPRAVGTEPGDPLSICPEPAEGPSFYLSRESNGEGFDKLSPNGLLRIGTLALALALAACSAQQGTPYERGVAAFEMATSEPRGWSC